MGTAMTLEQAVRGQIGKIYAQMSKIMAEVSPIAKGRKNTQQGYTFRGVDDVYQALQHIMAKHGVFSLPTVLSDRTELKSTKTGGELIYRILTIRYDFYAEDGSNVSATVIGEGMDSGDKASNKAMSVGDKYALLQAFKIPTDEPKDPENDGHDLTTIKAKDIYIEGRMDHKEHFKALAAFRGLSATPGLRACSLACVQAKLTIGQLDAAIKEWLEANP